MPKNATSEAVAELLRIDSTKSFRSPMDEVYIAVCERSRKLEEALQNLENDDGSIPDHAWKMVQDALAFDPLTPEA